MPIPKWAQELNLEQKLAKVEAQDAELKALKEKLESQEKQIKKLFGQLAAQELVTPAQTQQTTTRSRPGWMSKKRAEATSFACDATPDCVGHIEERHVEIHRAQVAKRLVNA